MGAVLILVESPHIHRRCSFSGTTAPDFIDSPASPHCSKLQKAHSSSRCWNWA